MMARTQIIISLSHDIHWNLAFEEWLFEHLEPEQSLMLLYVNDPCVVIGRAQNPYLECDSDALEGLNIKLARRQTGGGTVYHDRQNLNYSFMCPKNEYDITKNFKIIQQALECYDIELHTSPKHDLMVHCPTTSILKKVSGSAFRLTKDKALHHGTLLVQSQLDQLTSILKTKRKIINAKGVKSNPSPVINQSSKII